MPQAVVVGGGYIGMEVAAALNMNGLPVTMVFPEDRLMARLFTPEIAQFYYDVYTGKGIKIVSENTVASFEGTGGKVSPSALLSSVMLFLPALERVWCWSHCSCPRLCLWRFLHTERQFMHHMVIFEQKHMHWHHLGVCSIVMKGHALGAMPQVTHTVLKSGQKLESDLVVVGVGAKPNSGMFKGQLDLLEERPGGIKVSIVFCSLY